MTVMRATTLHLIDDVMHGNLGVEVVIGALRDQPLWYSLLSHLQIQSLARMRLAGEQIVLKTRPESSSITVKVPVMIGVRAFICPSTVVFTYVGHLSVSGAKFGLVLALTDLFKDR